MRMRLIKPEMWSSDDFISLSDFGQLMWVGLINYVDDNGVGKNNVLDIAPTCSANVLPTTLPRLFGILRKSRRNAEAWHGDIVRGEIDGKTVSLLFLTNWDRHQKISHPAKLVFRVLKPIPKHFRRLRKITVILRRLRKITVILRNLPL